MPDDESPFLPGVAGQWKLCKDCLPWDYPACSDCVRVDGTGATTGTKETKTTANAAASGKSSMNARIVRATIVGGGNSAGITFVDAAGHDVPVTVGSVEAGSPFNGLVNVGDVVLAVNGTTLIGCTMQDATAAAAQSASEIGLSVATYFTPTTVVGTN